MLSSFLTYSDAQGVAHYEEGEPQRGRARHQMADKNFAFADNFKKRRTAEAKTQRYEKRRPAEVKTQRYERRGEVGSPRPPRTRSGTNAARETKVGSYCSERTTGFLLNLLSVGNRDLLGAQAPLKREPNLDLSNKFLF